MKNIKFSLAILAIFACFSVCAKQQVVKETHIFGIVENDTLRLDRYFSPEMSNHNTLIFAFGGSFKAGNRDKKEYIPFFEYLAENGINVVSIDYRTKLKGVTAKTISSIPGFVGALKDAITAAVTDLYSATAFVIGKSEEWGTDPTKIVVSGSSAGAITALQAEYMIASGALTGIFPDWFNYAGVVSFAGAVCTKGEPIWTAKTSPLLMFHGDADTVVPFEKAVIKNVGLWGSKTISNKLDAIDIPHIFHIIKGASHEICKSPMNDNRNEILNFINDVTIGDGIKNITIITDRKPSVHEYNSQFTLEDYLKANL